jgi:hypothetical protein
MTDTGVVRRGADTDSAMRGRSNYDLPTTLFVARLLCNSFHLRGRLACARPPASGTPFTWGRGPDFGEITGDWRETMLYNLTLTWRKPAANLDGAMTNLVSKLLGSPLDRLSSWLRGSASEDINFSSDPARAPGKAHSSSRDLIATPPGSNSYPTLQGWDNFRRNSRPGRPLPIQLSIHTLDNVVRELVPFFGEHCPISVIYSKSPAQSVHHAEIVQATLSTIHSASDHSPHTRSAFILVG